MVFGVRRIVTLGGEQGSCISDSVTAITNFLFQHLRTRAQTAAKMVRACIFTG